MVVTFRLLKNEKSDESESYSKGKSTARPQSGDYYGILNR